MEPTKLTLSGKGDIHRAPERGVVSFTIQKSGTDQSAVSDNVQKTAQEIQTLVRDLAIRDADGAVMASTAVMRWSSSGLTMRTWTSSYYVTADEVESSSVGHLDSAGYDKQGRLWKRRIRRNFEATVCITTRFRDFEKLSTFVVSMATKPLVTVGDVDWVLTLETQELLKIEAIKKAYADAATKARAYADAAGLKRVRPVQIDESQSSYPWERSNTGMQMQMQMQVQMPQQQAMPQASQQSSFVPQDVRYSASCTVKFELD